MASILKHSLYITKKEKNVVNHDTPLILKPILVSGIPKSKLSVELTHTHYTNEEFKQIKPNCDNVYPLKKKCCIGTVGSSCSHWVPFLQEKLVATIKPSRLAMCNKTPDSCLFMD